MKTYFQLKPLPVGPIPTHKKEESLKRGSKFWLLGEYRFSDVSTAGMSAGMTGSSTSYPYSGEFKTKMHGKSMAHSGLRHVLPSFGEIQSVCFLPTGRQNQGLATLDY